MANRSRWMTPLEAAIVAAVVLVLVALLLPAIQAARSAAQRAQRVNNLKQIGLGMLNFDDVYKRLPPAVRRDKAGRPLSSWRFQLVPFLEAMMLRLDFADRWDGPVNRWLSSRPWCVYCWSHAKGFPESLHTNVVAITGPGTAFDEDRPTRLTDMITSRTVLAIEIADSGIHWMEPGDLSIDEVPESIMQGLNGDGLHVLFADGSVRFVSADVPLENLKKLFTIESAKDSDPDQLLGADR